MVPTLRTIMNSSYYYEYRENIHLGVKLTPALCFGSKTDIRQSFIYAVFILSFNILVSRNPEFVSFFRTFYWSTTNSLNLVSMYAYIHLNKIGFGFGFFV